MTDTEKQRAICLEAIRSRLTQESIKAADDIATGLMLLLRWRNEPADFGEQHQEEAKNILARGIHNAIELLRDH